MQEVTHRKLKLTKLSKGLIIAFTSLIIIALLIMILPFFNKDTNPSVDYEHKDKIDEDITLIEDIDILPEDPNVLALSDEADRDYIDETLFLGDSNTARFLDYIDSEGLPYTTVNNTIAVAGISAEAISSLACMQFSTGTYTMPQSVSILQPRRIIMTFGTNNLGFYNNPDNFKETYLMGINAVKNAYPYADIIINSIPPVTSNTKYTRVTNEEIRSFNKAILKMCRENDLFFLNSHETLVDKDGSGKYEYYDTDGLHLNNKGIEALFKYIRTHTLLTEDTRPKPLNDIPFVIGPMTNMLTINPLDDEPFEENKTPEPTPEESPKVTPEITPEVTPAPTSEVVPEPTPEITPDVTAEPTPESIIEPTPEIIPEPTPEVNPEPTPEAIIEPTQEAAPEPTPESIPVEENNEG